MATDVGDAAAAVATPRRVAVVGGGVTGAVCALEILRRGAGAVHVTVFDQGRGLGGRCCHRCAKETGDTVAPDEADIAFRFDHGCQFFRADAPRFREELLREWLERGWAAPWEGRFGSLSGDSDARSAAEPPPESPNFFGVPGQLPVYCGVGGMSSVPIGILAEARRLGAEVRPGVRVAGMSRLSSETWLLSGTSGQAAFHDTSEEEAAKASPDSLGEFDAVVVTDVSASMGGWHRASAGVPEAIAARVRGRTRVVLFTALVAFKTPLPLPLDAVAVADDALWFAARTSSKPGFAEANGGFDCWTLVSTPKYAAAEVERVPMQDPKTGAFRPQEPSYLKEGPCAVLLAAFERQLKAAGHGECLPLPEVAYIGGQRWGSAFPAPAGVGDRDATGRGSSTVEVLGVAYESAASLELAPGANGANGGTPPSGQDYLADDEVRLYYAGDYLSSGRPGVESAALSGLQAGQHVVATLVAT